GGHKQIGCRYKPGHWTSAVIEAKANKDDFVGEMEIGVYQDKGTRPVGLDALPYRLTDRRDVALSKGRMKGLHGSFYVPPGVEIASGKMTLAQRRGLQRFELPFPLTRMAAYQYHFVVLARSPDRYGFLNAIDSIRPPGGEADMGKGDYHYSVALVRADRQTPVPDGALFWTGIAYVLWDDVDPKSLTPEQQRALVDWLHWGGQLIVSGPDTLETLRGSFLDAYLPAKADGAWALAPGDFEDLNARFTLKGQRALAPVGEWSGVKLRLATDSQFVPDNGRLLAERRVGRGRVVVSAVRLNDRPLIDWPGFDGWFNACLLRRPARKFEPNEYGDDPVVAWADATTHRRDDAALTCNLRYFARDADVPRSVYTFSSEIEEATANPSGMGALLAGQGGSSLLDEREANGTGLAAWRNFSPAANAARRSLQSAACVEVPGRWFVIWVIAAYLGVLVPLNWFVFAAMGRVEWAWAAAPLIAVGCTLAVVHLARLDVGFARSETNLGVLELQSGYSRAHLAKYTALYTSLTTQYEFGQDGMGGLVQPFPTVDNPKEFRMLPGQGLGTLEYWHGSDSWLRGFSIPSNLVDFVHAEEMVGLDGPIDVLRNSSGGWEIINRTGLPLHGVGVIRRDAAGRIETAWVGELDRLSSAGATFVRAEADKGPWWPGDRNRAVATKAKAVKGEANVRELTDLAEQVDDLAPGEARLVGWTDAPIGDLKIKPAAPQSRQVTLVVAHLKYAAPGPPEADVNAKEQVKQQMGRGRWRGREGSR
ncbi:MAG TPA: hypothetical protein VJL29_01355, partial [Thermoguttaceae bacterium]|nr:hypothetical protein [Thermoguttaceae bacterium]